MLCVQGGRRREGGGAEEWRGEDALNRRVEWKVVFLVVPLMSCDTVNLDMSWLRRINQFSPEDDKELLVIM